MKVAILDGYVDEPSCLGVPPYIAPYPRYIYGILKNFGVNSKYFTIDQIRGREFDLEKFDLVIVIAGIAVPGKYLGGNPLSLKDLKNLASLNVEKILVGPITLEIDDKDRRYLEEFYEIVDYPFERKLLELLARRFKKNVKVASGRDFINRFAILGAEVVKQHPDFPYVICEIETYKGCYWGRCSFCIERFHKLEMRSPEGVIAEIKALYDNGVRYFRLGNQTDFFTYMADFRYDIPKPNPEFMKGFHKAIWENCPRIKTLHLDNVNPKTIAVHPEESREAIKTIITYQTPGNVGAMGLESADERVVGENNLCATPEEVKFAIRLVNEYRSVGYNGLPCFLPGINFVIGLKGETKRTFEKNYEFLKELLEEDLWVRRINIRQVKIFKGTPMEKVGYRNVVKHKKYFKVFKEKVRKEIDREMLKRIVPIGRKLADLRCELKKGRITFARQIATYPLLVGIVGEYERNTIIDARVVDYGQRSITAVPILNPNTAKLYQLEAVPGIGKALAGKIIANRPYSSLDELRDVLGDVFDRVKHFFEI
ncbi:helix-hairpin-helix domain-containing protein [Archaeoglobus profundus]|uniref:Radical SAM domain protein n=1 Tax=Archaeoglobus profundus (strain DSM 5631 / JCM 9629 / NBRC 100127 / Av18) TaxID=572546 RepID=D2RI86_ARCPA|nr:helix-hairpin-helix domain-containing protein [Archaeoglobus profundus]ADB58011.1 Radical SAM domain protein [Archaeoglobus profundus DSM 5631]